MLKQKYYKAKLEKCSLSRPPKNRYRLFRALRFVCTFTSGDATRYTT